MQAMLKESVCSSSLQQLDALGILFTTELEMYEACTRQWPEIPEALPLTAQEACSRAARVQSEAVWVPHGPVTAHLSGHLQGTGC